MTVPITDPVSQTKLFLGLLFLILLFSSRRRSMTPSLSTAVSTELKGIAILAILFAHIGYYLAQDHRFLFPFSVLAGVGVDLFLFLSGYGLTHSLLHKQMTIVEFYLRRISRVFIPFWIVLAIFVIVDRLFLGLHYPLKTIFESIIGFFPTANLYESLNAPFWYLTLILFYYVLFPLFFWKKAPLLSALMMAAIGYVVVHLPLPVDESVLASYRTHLFAFPLGMSCVALYKNNALWIQRIFTFIKTFFEKKNSMTLLSRLGLTFGFLSLICYFAIYSGVGKGVWHEQVVSLFTMICFISACVFAPIENRFLIWIGSCSYEIYLIHWPLLYRYDLFYSLLPAGVATLLYLFLFLGISFLLQKCSIRLLAALRLK